jgi:hypothetical protein
MAQTMKVKITKLEFDWNFPPNDPLPPDHDLYQNIGVVYEVPDQYAEEDAIYEFLTEKVIDTNFPIEDLQWEVVEE